MKAKMPTSRATNAYQLLEDVRQIILAEPKRYNQMTILRRGRGLDWTPIEERPACGTIGCVAGWVTVLNSPRSHNPITAAQRILGLDEDQLSQLVRGDAAGLRNGRLTAHAHRGAAHIAHFLKQHAKQLKAKRV